MPCRWRRPLLCLALGGLTTLLVAWGLAVSIVVSVSPPRSRVQAEGQHTTPDQRRWYCAVLGRPGLTVVTWTSEWSIRGATTVTAGSTVFLSPATAPIASGELPGWARPPADLLAAGGRHGTYGASSARGWPMRALWYEATFTASGTRLDRGGLAAPEMLAAVGPGRVLPCRVLALGFAADTAFWAAAWWGLLALAELVVRAARRREGFCTRCGYDLRGAAHDRCPECGAGCVEPGGAS